MQFWGYKRKEGRAGIRNHVLILLPVPAAVRAAGSCKSGARCSQHRVHTGCSDVAANTAMSQKS